MFENQSETEFITREGGRLDIKVYKPEKLLGCLIVYPCIGGSTKTYNIPINAILKKGYALVEYHPPNHGRSTGQMAMETALHNLYHFLAFNRLSHLPFVTIGHSAGCNALLQINRSFLNIKKYIFVQPVFDFRESMFYMYKKGTYNEFLYAISKWVTDFDALQSLLSNFKWLNPEYWFVHNICDEINKISSGMKLGSFLENFYVPGFNTYDLFRSLGGNPIVVISKNDNWYPPETIIKLCQETGTQYKILEQSPDHYFTNTWPIVWDIILEQI